MCSHCPQHSQWNEYLLYVYDIKEIETIINKLENEK